MQLQHGRQLIGHCLVLHINGLQHFAGLLVGARCFRAVQGFAHGVQLLCAHCWRRLAVRDLALFIHPGDGLQLRVLGDQRLGAGIKVGFA